MDGLASRVLRRRLPFGALALVVCLWPLQLAKDAAHVIPVARPVVVSMASAPRPVAAAPARGAMQRASPKPTKPDAPSAIDTAQAEVCGLGPVAPAVEQTAGLQRIPAPLRERALDDIEARMLASPDLQVQAAALLIAARTRGSAGTRIDRLARLAAVSQDPVVYAIALEGCQAGAGDAAASCALLSHAQWVRLDPHNAQPWLELAAQAERQHDGEAQHEAMRRAATAQHSETTAALLPGLAERALGPHAPRLQRTLAVAASWSTQASWRPSHTSQAYAYCVAGLDADPSRRGTCDALADTLTRHGTGVAELGVGLAIGRRLGWPAPRWHALQQEHDAIHEATGMLPGGPALDCRSIDRLQAWMRELGAGGELEAMRRAIARSGRSVEDWSAQFRRSFALAVATVETASLAGAGGETPP